MENITQLSQNIARAYAIALLGNFKLQIIFDKDYIAGFEDYKIFKNFYNKVEFSNAGDIKVQLHKIDEIKVKENLTQKKRNKKKPDRTFSYSSIEFIHELVEQSKNNKAIDESKFYENSSITYLNTVKSKLNLSVEQIKKIIKIAQTISQLDNRQENNSFDCLICISEATLYVRDDWENMCNAEEKTIQFGKGIHIALFDLDESDIQQAINYLQNLLS